MAALTETLLRRHGNEIVSQQLQTKRLADVAIDLLAMCAVIARTTRLIEKNGEAGSAQPMSLTLAFCSEAYRRIRTNFRAAARNNDAELKAAALHVIETGKAVEDILSG